MHLGWIKRQSIVRVELHRLHALRCRLVATTAYELQSARAVLLRLNEAATSLTCRLIEKENIACVKQLYNR